MNMRVELHLLFTETKMRVMMGEQEHFDSLRTKMTAQIYTSKTGSQTSSGSPLNCLDICGHHSYPTSKF